MNGEVEYLFREIERCLLLVRTETNNDGYFDEIEQNLQELQRLWNEGS